MDITRRVEIRSLISFSDALQAINRFSEELSGAEITETDLEVLHISFLDLERSYLNHKRKIGKTEETEQNT